MKLAAAVALGAVPFLAGCAGSYFPGITTLASTTTRPAASAVGTPSVAQDGSAADALAKDVSDGKRATAVASTPPPLTGLPR